MIYDESDIIFEEYFKDEYEKVVNDKPQSEFTIQKELHIAHMAKYNHCYRDEVNESEVPQGTLKYTIAYNHVQNITDYINNLKKHKTFYGRVFKGADEFIIDVKRKSRNILIDEVI